MTRLQLVAHLLLPRRAVTPAPDTRELAQLRHALAVRDHQVADLSAALDVQIRLRAEAQANERRVLQYAARLEAELEAHRTPRPRADVRSTDDVWGQQLGHLGAHVPRGLSLDDVLADGGPT